ncbi:MAG: hypothetical protein NVS3B19_09550 [Ginsengibacter sp.]
MNYTIPVIVKEKTGKWFVFFRFTHDGKIYRFKFSEGLNRLRGKEKEIKFEVLRDVKQEWLDRSWNPVIGLPPVYEETEKMTFINALEFAKSKKEVEWSHRTKQEYTSVIKFIKKQAGDLANKDILFLKRADYRNLLDRIQEKKGSPNQFNKYRTFLSSLLSELIQYDIIEYNPVEKIKPKETVKKLSHRPPTQEQRLLIVTKIKNEHPNYFLFLCVLYGCTIRPKEICGLKIKNYEKDQQIFRLIPDKEGATKTKFEREVIIPDWVIKMLDKLELEKYPDHYYIFSKDFLPGPKRLHAVRTSELWKEIVIDGLEIDVTQYSLKKMSGNDMVKLQRSEGADRLLNIAQSQMGHQSSKMTEVYVDEHLEVMKELIKKKMPEH